MGRSQHSRAPACEARRRIVRDVLIVLAAGLVLVVAVAWFFPITGRAAVDRAKDARVEAEAGATWGELIEDYEQAVGRKGSWRARHAGGDFLWEVTYTAQGIEGKLWFGVKTRLGGVSMNDGSPMIRAAMESALRK